MEQTKMDKDLSQIIITYRNISQNFLKFAKYILMFFFSIIFIALLFVVKGETTTSYIAGTEKKQDGKTKIDGGYLATKINFGEDITFLKKYNISILGGYITYTGGQINSVFNMVGIYPNDGFTLPYNFTVDKKDKIPSKLSFSLASINQVINTFILGESAQFNYASGNDIELKNLKTNSIEKTFDIGCANSPIKSPFCGAKARAVISNLPMYDLSQDIAGTKKLYSILKNDYKDELCKAFMQYIYNSSVFNDEFRGFFSECGGTYLSDFDKAKTFNEINDSLKNNVINSRTYNDKSMNAYKLVSAQRLIFLNKDNENIFDSCSNYLSLLSDLNKTKLLDKFYFYEAFVFNNSYLKKILQSKIVGKGTDVQKSKQIQEILDQIKQINNGDSILGNQGLISNINNTKKDILELSKNNVQQQQHTSAPQFLDDTFKTYLSLLSSDYVATSIKVNSETNTFMSYGAVIIKDSNNSNAEAKSIYMKIFYKYENGTFYATDVSITAYPDLQNALKKQILSSNTKLGDIISYIKSYNLDTNQGKQNFCQTIQTASKDIPGVSIQQCSDQYIFALINGVNSHFYFDTNQLTSYDIGNQSIQKKVNDYLGQYDIILKSTFPQYLKIIASIKADTQSQNINSSEIIAIVNKMKSFFGGEVKIGKKTGSAYEIYFETSGIKFKGLIDSTQSYKLYNLSFDEGTIAINGFSLNLVDVNQLEINKFKIDTLRYLARIDPTAVRAYLGQKGNQ